MKIKELIELLATKDPEAEVVAIAHHQREFGYEITEVLDTGIPTEIDSLGDRLNPKPAVALFMTGDCFDLI